MTAELERAGRKGSLGSYPLLRPVGALRRPPEGRGVRQRNAEAGAGRGRRGEPGEGKAEGSSGSGAGEGRQWGGRRA